MSKYTDLRQFVLFRDFDKSLVLSLKMHFVDSTSTKVPETGSKFQFILWQMEIRSADMMLSFYLQK